VSIALKALLAHLPPSTQVVGNAEIEVDSLEIDSRHVRPGAMFVAVRGDHADGHAYVAEAIAAGARAVVMEVGHRTDLPPSVTGVYVPDTRRWVSSIAATYYGEPSKSLDVVGVTGTNGKTTTTHMIARILSVARRPCGIIGTIGAVFAEHTWPLQNTTPLPPELHGLLARMKSLGATAVAMEVSSHALALDRVEDIHFAVGVFTNISRDHLDFHRTMEAYAAAKRRLFSLSRAAVINIDDEYGALWASAIRRQIPVVTYSLKGNADLVARHVETNVHARSFVLDGRDFVVPMAGAFNVANALAAIGVARSLGIDDALSAEALYKLPPVEGRMEYVGDGVLAVFVDYAHTPDALEQALEALRPDAEDGLTVVFGCGGDRDRGKRPEMGAVAARFADRVIVTSDNPRTEDPQAIVDEIVAGIGSHPHTVVLDRQEAIECAIEEAVPGEVILIAGKGHEKYQIIGSTTNPFDDIEVARAALRARRLRK
jgi:UDP-N-acetylmuramoyl-L-alanyl-D-glutamate--2,6-diaminopimelate ligase